MLKKITNGIYKIIIPFENIYTSSFLLCNSRDAIVLDSGCNAEDVAQYIIPSIASLQAVPKYLVSSHTHGDHHGGIGALMHAYPDAIPARFSECENGIDKYGILIDDVDLYRKTIARLRTMPLSAIYASHEYEPLGSVAIGEEVETYLECCEQAVKNK